MQQPPPPAQRPILLCACLFLALSGLATAAPIKLDARDWVFESSKARIEGEELILDGRSGPVRAFYLPQTWSKISVSAQFKLDPAEKGVLACGFVVRAKDSQRCYYVHYDKSQAILCASDEQESWRELSRASALVRPAGEWHLGKIECEGSKIRVYLNGEFLYEVEDATYAEGRIGFYANQGIAHVGDIQVDGRSYKTREPFIFPAADFVHVCTDAGAGAYEAFPDVCRLADGRLMCVFYAGYGHVALPNENLPKGGRISCCYSEDEGRTWSPAQTLYDGPDDDRDPSIAQLSNGDLICSYFSLRKLEEGKPPWKGLGSWMVRSTDGGTTWSAPQCISTEYYCSSPVRELRDGRLVLGLYAEKEDDAFGAVVFSEDMGKSWGEVIDIDNNGLRLDAETDIIELSDGRLYAAQRGHGQGSGAWSISEDGGKTWRPSEAYGYVIHCPYLHRTLDGILLMAHRKPETSLRYSLDEGATWSESVSVDNVGGAYPSMVTLKDGTTLIVYYEEGEGSSIRARRFLATHKGIEWLPVAEGVLPEATVVDYRRIWDQAKHNAFTNLIFWENAWYCVFREGDGHVSENGALRILTSVDGDTWESAACITSPTADLRDAQITVTPDNQLMLSGAAALHQPADAKHQSMAYFSSNGKDWSEGVAIGDPNMWLWRVSWHKGLAYSFGYATGEGDKFIRLYRSKDGKTFETLIENALDKEYPNESSIVFLEDDRAVCLLRRGGTGMIGLANPPYDTWAWKDLGVKIGGPHMIQLPDGRFVAAVRLYDGKVRTALCWVDPEAGTIREFLALPSGGDTSYPGLVWKDNLLWVSYYASHEGKTAIYLAKVAFD